MARIKSAWEIALEKTKDIELDEARFRTDTLTKEGMALAGSYLNNMDQTIEATAERYSSYSSEDRALVRQGMMNTVFSNINLPNDDLYSMRFERISNLVGLLSQGDAQTMGLMSQIGDFLKQYVDCKKDFVERMQAQIRQAMQENPESVNSAQYSQIIQQNLKKMDSQYGDALENTREELRQLLS